MEMGLELVKLMECGALVNLPVNVSVTYTASILLIAPLQSLSCPLEALSTLTTSLERAPLPSPVTLSYPPAAGNKTTPMEGLSEGGEDQTETFLKQVVRDYVTRGISTISLNRRGNDMLAGGVFCCTIPRASDIIQTFCVDMQGEFI